LIEVVNEREKAEGEVKAFNFTRDVCTEVKKIKETSREEFVKTEKCKWRSILYKRERRHEGNIRTR